MRIRMTRIACLALLLVLAGTAGLGEAAMNELRDIRKSAEEAIVEIIAPTPAPTEDPADAPAEPAPTPSYEALEKGAKGDAVAQLQQKLIAAGCLKGTADGSYGAQTEKAVRDFQAAQGLEVTGVADAQTQALLSAIDAPVVYTWERLNYKKLTADMDAWTGRRVELSGTVMQALTDDTWADSQGVYTVLRVAGRGKCYDPVYVSCFLPPDANIPAEGDAVAVRGLVRGWMTYLGAAGGEVTVPWVEAEEIE